MRNKPGFALAAIATLALGIGANTAMFGVVNAVFLRPLPYPNADRVVWATEYFPKLKGSMVFASEYAAWTRASTFERLAAMGTTIGVNFSSGKKAAERVQAGHVSTNFFATLGIQPHIGPFPAVATKPSSATPSGAIISTPTLTFQARTWCSMANRSRSSE